MTTEQKGPGSPGETLSKEEVEAALRLMLLRPCDWAANQAQCGGTHAANCESCQAAERIRRHIASLSPPTPEEVARDYETVRGRLGMAHEMAAAIRLRDWAARAQGLETWQVDVLHALAQGVDYTPTADKAVGVLKGIISEVKEMEQRLSTAEAERDAARKGESLLTGQLRESYAEAESLRSQVGTLETDLSNVRRLHGKAVLDGSAAVTRAEAAERRVAELEGQLAEGEERLRVTRESLDGCTRRVATLAGAMRKALDEYGLTAPPPMLRALSEALKTPLPSTHPAPAGLLEAVAVLLRLDGPSIAGHTTWNNAVEAVRAAFDAARAGSPPTGLLEAVAPVVESLRWLQTPGVVPEEELRVPLGWMTGRRALALLAAFDAEKGGETLDRTCVVEAVAEVHALCSSEGMGTGGRYINRKWRQRLTEALGLTLDTPPSDNDAGKRRVAATQRREVLERLAKYPPTVTDDGHGSVAMTWWQGEEQRAYTVTTEQFRWLLGVFSAPSPSGPGGGERCSFCKDDPDAQCPECCTPGGSVADAIQRGKSAATPTPDGQGLCMGEACTKDAPTVGAHLLECPASHAVGAAEEWAQADRQNDAQRRAWAADATQRPRAPTSTHEEKALTGWRTCSNASCVQPPCAPDVVRCTACGWELADKQGPTGTLVAVRPSFVKEVPPKPASPEVAWEVDGVRLETMNGSTGVSRPRGMKDETVIFILARALAGATKEARLLGNIVKKVESALGPGSGAAHARVAALRAEVKAVEDVLWKRGMACQYPGRPAVEVAAALDQLRERLASRPGMDEMLAAVYGVLVDAESSFRAGAPNGLVMVQWGKVLPLRAVYDFALSVPGAKVVRGIHKDRTCGACNGPLETSRDAVCETCAPESVAHATAESMGRAFKIPAEASPEQSAVKLEAPSFSDLPSQSLNHDWDGPDANRLCRCRRLGCVAWKDASGSMWKRDGSTQPWVYASTSPIPPCPLRADTDDVGTPQRVPAPSPIKPGVG